MMTRSSHRTPSVPNSPGLESIGKRVSPVTLSDHLHVCGGGGWLTQVLGH